jgi:AcrR family transcriptional regulator
MFPLGAPGSLDITPADPNPDRPAKPTPAQLRETRRHAIRQAAARLLAAGEPPAINRQQLAADLAITREALNLLYPSDAELIAAILAEFAHSLVNAVCAAFDAAEELGALARLEAVIRAWLDYLAAHSIQHRAFLATLPRLEEPHRSTITSKYQSAIDTLADALYPAIPGLQATPPALLTTATTLLNEAWALSHRAVEPRGQTARRIAAILITIGTADATGHWPGFGPPVGVGPHGQRAIPCRQARTQFHDLLDYVSEGGEVILSRRGKIVGKVIRTT